MKHADYLAWFRLRPIFALMASITLSWLIPLSGQSEPDIRSAVTLTAGQSQGGEIITIDANRSAVALPAPSSPEQKFRWELPAPLALGWWEVTVEFAKRPKDSPRMKFFFGTELTPVFDLTNAEQAWNIERFRLRLWNTSPIKSLEVSPQRRMPEAIRAIERVTFTPVDGPNAEGDTDVRMLGILVDAVPTQNFGESTNSIQMSLPSHLPGGNWQIIQRQEKRPEGTPNISKTLTVHLSGGTHIEAPISGTVNIFSEQAPLSLEWATDASLKGAVLQYVPPYKPNLPHDREIAALPVFSPTERTQILLTFQAAGKGNVALPLLPSGARVAVVTSWDDGAANDQRCATALEKHGFRGTFFLMQNKASDRAFLADLEGRGMEIALHTLNHPHAWTIAPDLWAADCLQMRLRLEEALGHPVISFAYPYNYVPAYDRHGDYVLRGVREAGYFSGRSTRNGGESITGYAEPLALVTDAHFLVSPERLEKAWQRAQSQPGGVFYFWGHFYEIRNEADWEKFDTLLARYAQKPDAWYATQGQIFLWRWLRENVRIENLLSTDKGWSRVALSWPKLDSWLAKQVPFTLQMPEGVTEIRIENAAANTGARIVPVIDGFATIPTDLLQ